METTTNHSETSEPKTKKHVKEPQVLQHYDRNEIARDRMRFQRTIKTVEHEIVNILHLRNKNDDM